MHNINNKQRSQSQKKSLTPKTKPAKFGSLVLGNNLTSFSGVKSSGSFSRLDSRTKIVSRPVSTKSNHPDKKLFNSRPEQLARKKSVNSPSPSPLRDSQKSLNLNSNSRSIQGQPHHGSTPKSKSRSPNQRPEEIIRQQIFISTPKHFNIQAREIRHSLNSHPHIYKVDIQLPNYQPARFSDKTHGLIRCYSACTNQGTVRDYNEDRVAIVLKKTAYFGVFDGHGGVGCSNFLRDKLISYVFQQKNFLANIPQSINQGFYKCEQAFMQFSKNSPQMDPSGSCAIAVFINADMCYVTNVGDSRAIMSSCGGDRVSQLSIDHKPTDQYEQKRIIENGGKIYQTKLQNANPHIPIHYDGEDVPFIIGPHRVFPGRLSVTRTFGDIEAKLPQLGGNPKAVISTPEIRSFRLTKDNDFIIIASDGIYDKMSNDEVIQVVWHTAKQRGEYQNIHQFCGIAAQRIIKYSIHKKTQDNVTVVMIGLENLERTLFPENFPSPQGVRQVKRPTSKSRSNSRSSKLVEVNGSKQKLRNSRSFLEQHKKMIESGRKPTTPKNRNLLAGFRTEGH